MSSVTHEETERPAVARLSFFAVASGTETVTRRVLITYA